jgi:uncharacterized membrane protein YhiD involved in acid resistance
LALTAILSYFLGLLYARYGNSLSNKKSFASNFELIGLTTMIIITIVKSSLALSLGLVGALSIVRFRAAIKEPQELAYIFFTIALGLGFGADQRLITVIGFAFLGLVIFLKNHFKSSDMGKNLNFTILTQKPLNISFDSIVESISAHSKDMELKRLDENNKFLEASFLVEFNNFKELNEVRTALHELDDSIQINFLDHKGIV